MLARAAADQRSVRYMAYIPQAWVPAFIGGNSPKEALDRANLLMNMMPAPERAQFEYIHHFLRASCQKLGGASAQRNGSKMVLALTNPGRTTALTSWAIRQLASFYPSINQQGPTLRHLAPSEPPIWTTTAPLGTTWLRG
jgi:hypothetical protein